MTFKNYSKQKDCYHKNNLGEGKGGGICRMGNTDNGNRMMEEKTETFPLYLTGSISPSVVSRYRGL